MKQLNGNLLLEALPLIQGLVQQNTASHGPGVQGGPTDSNPVLPSSLSESDFVDILSALGPLPDFCDRLAMVNEQGQTLLHLAVHLRYRILVQKLIHWGIDTNVKDVSGSTALHAAYLCDDPFAITLLEQGGAEPFLLDKLGRTPNRLAAPTATVDEDTTMGIDEMVLDDFDRVDEQRLPPGPPTPMQTQRTAIVHKPGEPVEYISRSVVVVVLC